MYILAIWYILEQQNTWISHPKMKLLPLIYPLHWIPEEQLEEKMWRCQVIKPYCLLNCFFSLLRFANPVHKGGIKSNQSGFLKSMILIIQIKLPEEQLRTDSSKCKGRGAKHAQQCAENEDVCVSEGKWNSDVFSKRSGTLSPQMPSLPYTQVIWWAFLPGILASDTCNTCQTPLCPALFEPSLFEVIWYMPSTLIAWGIWVSLSYKCSLPFPALFMMLLFKAP